jgi:hypothetical protein
MKNKIGLAGILAMVLAQNANARCDLMSDYIEHNLQKTDDKSLVKIDAAKIQNFLNTCPIDIRRKYSVESIEQILEKVNERGNSQDVLDTFSGYDDRFQNENIYRNTSCEPESLAYEIASMISTAPKTEKGMIWDSHGTQITGLSAKNREAIKSLCDSYNITDSDLAKIEQSIKGQFDMDGTYGVRNNCGTSTCEVYDSTELYRLTFKARDLVLDYLRDNSFKK